MLALAVAALLVQSPPQGSDAGVAALRRAAGRAHAEYESAARALAPFTRGQNRPSGCDEYVGRFCLTFSPRREQPPLLPEPRRIGEARTEAIEAFQRLLEASPADSAAASQLVRLLVEDLRADEALAIARRFAAASNHGAWADLLAGFAAHAAGDAALAVAHFHSALPAMPVRARARVESVAPLLERDERRIYERFDPGERTSYHDRFWRMADPLYLTGANESWAEHVARFVWARLLERPPPAMGVLPWGPDLEELTIRYGVPVSRERIPGSSGVEIRLIERYSPDQLAFAPAGLATRGMPPAPDPGQPWPLDRPDARSAYAPERLRLMELPHQVTRFPRSDSILIRFDARTSHVVPDARGVEAGLFILDAATAHGVREERRRLDHPADEGVALSFRVVVAPGDYIYGLEARAVESATAARARYPVRADAAASSGPRVSDVLLAHPFEPGTPLPHHAEDARVRPRTSMVLAPGDTIGLFVEAAGLARDGHARVGYEMQVRLEPDPTTGIAAWLSRVLGRQRSVPPRMTWSGWTTLPDPFGIAVNLELGGLPEGSYTLRLTVRDRFTGIQRESTRRLRILAGG